MFSITKRFNPSQLPRIAIIVGCLHIIGCIGSSIGAVYALITTEPVSEFNDVFHNDDMITIIISSVFALIGLLLIIGAWKKFHLMLLPWLIIEGLMLVLYFMQTFFNLMDFRSFDLSRIDLSIVRFLIIGLCAYVWFGILTLYQYIRDEKRKSSTENYKEYLLCSKTDPNEVSRRIESYPPPYVIPITYSDPKQPLSQIKY